MNTNMQPTTENKSGVNEGNVHYHYEGVPLKSDLSFGVTIILAFFLGIVGAHRFYVGKIGTGIIMLFTLGGLGIWTMIDLVIIAFGEFKDNNGKKITYN